jgi:hypothetical protein
MEKQNYEGQVPAPELYDSPEKLHEAIQEQEAQIEEGVSECLDLSEGLDAESLPDNVKESIQEEYDNMNTKLNALGIAGLLGGQLAVLASSLELQMDPGTLQYTAESMANASQVAEYGVATGVVMVGVAAIGKLVNKFKKSNAENQQYA